MRCVTNVEFSQTEVACLSFSCHRLPGEPAPFNMLSAKQKNNNSYSVKITLNLYLYHLTKNLKLSFLIFKISVVDI